MVRAVRRPRETLGIRGAELFAGLNSCSPERVTISLYSRRMLIDPRCRSFVFVMRYSAKEMV